MSFSEVISAQFNRPTMTRKQAEKIANEHAFCSIHNRPMVEYGASDLCGTYPTFCEECGK